jgi:D-alanyl-D-alanine carboxypeptidase (penicillin-binding protein 5/6)
MRLNIVFSLFFSLIWTGSMMAGLAAESSIVVDVETGIVLLSENPDEKRQVASLTKVATILVTLKWLDENKATDEVEIAVSAEAVSGGVNPLKFEEGDCLSLRSAMLAAMMASDNTSAYAIAEFVGSRLRKEASESGAVSRFVAKMNHEAAALRLSDTRFVNPHGLDEGSDLGESTAADMAMLAIEAIKHPQFLALCRESEATIEVTRGGRERNMTIKNTNQLVGSRGIDGVKTGTTRRSGPCLMATAVSEVSGSERLVSVVLNAEDRFRETVLLLNRAWEVYRKSKEEGAPETNRRLLIAPN